MPLSSNFVKGVTIWNRLEPRPRKVDFDRTLRAEIRDALWMLTRQWQFGELTGQDTGTAIFARAEMESTKITKISQKGNEAITLDNTRILEADVEKEIVDYDTALRIEMGQHFFKILKKKLVDAGATPTEISAIVTEFKTATTPTDLSFSLPAETPENAALYSNRNVWKVTAAVAQNRAIDGGKLRDYLNALATNKASDFSASTSYGIAVDTAGTDFLDWFIRVYSQPASEADSAWIPQRLEYQFACSAPNATGGPTLLCAEEYHNGRLDWYSFDIESDSGNVHSTLANNEPQAGDIESKTVTVVPSDIKFAGMPNARWWKMEDSKVDLGEIDANTTDTAKVLLAEFGLIYSNDWTIIPWTVPVGTLCEVKQIIVTDVFGQRTKVEGAGKSLDNPFAWNMYGLHTRGTVDEPDNRLLIPPVVHKMQESAPVEAINFIRDEMANMVWGVETLVSGGLGIGVDGYELANSYRAYLEKIAVPGTPVSLLPNDAQIKYLFANTVPENWIPFVPVKEGASLTSREVKLQRAAMPRIIDGLDPERVRPRTELLKEGYDESDNSWSPYFIHEEEIPRSGSLITRTWQRTRQEDGTVVTWLGRRKSNGRGEGSSGLAFDVIGHKSAE
jgi:hypothetical protein